MGPHIVATYWPPGNKVIIFWCQHCREGEDVHLPIPLAQVIEKSALFAAKHAACVKQDAPTGPF